VNRLGCRAFSFILSSRASAATRDLHFSLFYVVVPSERSRTRLGRSKKMSSATRDLSSVLILSCHPERSRGICIFLGLTLSSRASAAAPDSGAAKNVQRDEGFLFGSYLVLSSRAKSRDLHFPWFYVVIPSEVEGSAFSLVLRCHPERAQRRGISLQPRPVNTRHRSSRKPSQNPPHLLVRQSRRLRTRRRHRPSRHRALDYSHASQLSLSRPRRRQLSHFICPAESIRCQNQLEVPGLACHRH
jgi:hypothetical protein